MDPPTSCAQAAVCWWWCPCDMRQAFVSIVNSYVGYFVAFVLRHHGFRIVGSTGKEDTEDIVSLVSETVDADDEVGTARLALLSDVVVLCLIEDLRGADAVLSALQMQILPENEHGRPSHLLLLSTTMTWAKTRPLGNFSSMTAGTAVMSSERPSSSSSRALSRPVSMMAVDKRSAHGGGVTTGGLPRASSAISRSSPSRDGSRPLGTASSKNSGGASHASGLSRRRHPGFSPEPALTENDYLQRQPPAGFLEHKRLEVAALQLQSSFLSTCVVGAGVPYGLGEGPLLLRTFREAWRARGAPVALPTCASGENRVALIHVADLSAAVGNLLRPVEPNALPMPFPKPYILIVEGNDAQCTAREMTAAIGRSFGGSGETRPMGEVELEDVLVEDPKALTLLINMRFSNDGGVLAGMVGDGTWKPVCWSRGFAASAKSVAQEFMDSRSLRQIKAVVLGPPGGDQDYVCRQVSQRYGILKVDAKIAVDGVFDALGKPLPQPTPPEEKAPPAAKGKKGKEAKKGAGKSETSPETQAAALAALPPTDRLLAEIQAAFEAADVPLSEYTNLDAGGLSRLLPPSIVARSARLLLERTRLQWACSGFVLSDIPASGDVASELFEDRPIASPSTPAAGTNTTAGVAVGGEGPGSPQSRGGGSCRSATGEHTTAGAQSDVIVGDFHPTHVVYLHASLEHIVARQVRDAGTRACTEGTQKGGEGGVSIEGGGRLREDLERYFTREERKDPPESTADDGGSLVSSTSAPIASAPSGKQQARRKSSKGPGKDKPRAATAEEPGTGEASGTKSTPPEERWVPATARALEHRFGIEVKAVDVEGADGGVSGVVAAVDEHLCGGKLPGFVWMLSEGADGGALVGAEGTGEGSKCSPGAEGGEKEKVEERLLDGGVCGAFGQGGGEAAEHSREADNGDGNTAAYLDDAGSSANDGFTLTEVLAKLTARDAKEVEARTKRHRNFLTEGVVPQVAAGLVAAAEARPANVFEFLAEYLISAGQALQTKAEEEAARKYETGLALLREMEAKDKKCNAGMAGA